MPPKKLSYIALNDVRFIYSLDLLIQIHTVVFLSVCES